MSDDLLAQLRGLLSLRPDIGEDLYAQSLRRLRELHGASLVDTLLAQITPAAPAPGGVAVNIVTESGTISGAPVSIVAHAEHVTFPPPSDPAEARRAAALVAYLRRTIADCNALPLGQIDRTDAAYPRPLELARVYIGLHTTTQVELSADEAAALKERSDGAKRSTRPLSALESLAHAKGSLMLLGAPGSGKSTFVSHLALCLAGAALCTRRANEPQPDAGWLACLPRWNFGNRVPVRIILRDLAAFAPLAAAPRGSVRLLEDFLASTLSEAGCAEAQHDLVAALREGEALLLLDGFDEVVGKSVLQRVAETIHAARRTYRAQMIVTCRVLDYQEEPIRQIQGFAAYTLADLDDEQIQQFVQDWYRELAESGRRPAAQATQDAGALAQALATRAELRTLAATPLLLTVMALVHAFRGALPDARALLYAECIDLLLLRWRQPRGEVDLLERLNLSQFRSTDLLDMMARLGYVAHTGAERSPNTAQRPADLDEPQVVELFAEGFARYDEPRKYQLAEIILGALVKGNGLLLKRGPKTYTFAHRTFQEFLAGYHLKGQKEYHKLCIERADQPHWHEALTLMVGYQVLNSELEKPLDLATKLLARSPLEQALAGELLNLIGRERADAYDPNVLKLPDGLWPTARRRLLDLLTKGQAPAVPATLRHRAGLALGLLCYGPLKELSRPAVQVPMPDPRLPFAVLGLPTQRSQGWQKSLAHYWCSIAAGPFWFGDDRSEQLQQLRIAQPYRIGRYPVTNAEYARFLAANGPDGYDPTKPWWTDAGRQYLFPNGEPRDTEPRYWHHPRFNSPLQPVVGVSWYEAAAYCRWLSASGWEQGWLPQDQAIRLPTWLEWERAARHIDQRRHPWGAAAPTPEHANYKDTGIGAPTPVGCFPLGNAVDGIQDMLGNVMEWTATPDAQPEQPHAEKDFTPSTGVVVSYSGWVDGVEDLCCGSRLRYNPLNWVIIRSFRVFWSLRAL
ncbi:NACHT domain-containing protein [Candidatus Oscillochloris fontis]|uniref:NACHT domain-containing protein n=1 Tax=Candidatus Oscillochloris fontis TaxID=2496868 RepID=UPI001375C2ED|nr:SUMF1/EgtB/PvdO family nonheme iron enzyme [Candidatus Oscillochloris fontis]